MGKEYTQSHISDGQELLERVRLNLRATKRFAYDGLTGTLSPRDALSLILNDSEHMLDVVKASKDAL